MLLRKIIILLLLTAVFSFSKAQDVELYLVTIKGVVSDIESGEPIPYAHVINPRNHSGTITNADGFFSMTMLTEDTLVIRAIGFIEQDFNINEFPPKELYEVILKPVRYLIGEVTVNEEYKLGKKLGLPQAKPLDIPVELRGSDFNEKPPWYAAFVNPIGVLYYHTGKEEKRKRETLKTIKNNEEWLKFSKHHNLETIEELTGLKGIEADKFMLYCNINNKLPHFASQMEIEFQIMDLYFKYKSEREQKAKTDSVR
ncbi:MAG: carboxypeptidase-like regulatory domain-containing protein [Prolixibacteraceae bacterium]|nr:carboxypeptidase-like regulatory domain-containing protein [Prolixibacteraceae bacterium]